MAKKYKVEIDIDLNDAELEDLEKNLKDAKLEAGNLKDELDSLGESKGAAKAAKDISKVGTASKDTSKDLDQLGKEVEKTGSVMGTAGKKMSGDLQEVQDDAIAAGGGMKNIQMEAVQAGSATGTFAQKGSGAFSKVTDEVRKTAAEIKKLETEVIESRTSFKTMEDVSTTFSKIAQDVFLLSGKVMHTAESVNALKINISQTPQDNFLDHLPSAIDAIEKELIMFQNSIKEFKKMLTTETDPKMIKRIDQALEQTIANFEMNKQQLVDFKRLLETGDKSAYIENVNAQIKAFQTEAIEAIEKIKSLKKQQVDLGKKAIELNISTPGFEEYLINMDKMENSIITASKEYAILSEDIQNANLLAAETTIKLNETVDKQSQEYKDLSKDLRDIQAVTEKLNTERDREYKTINDSRAAIEQFTEANGEMLRGVEKEIKEKEDLIKANKKVADTTGKTTEKLSKQAKVVKGLKGGISNVGMAIAGAFSGAVFALVNRVVDAIVNIKPVADFLNDTFVTIDTTVKVLTGHFDDMFETLDDGSGYLDSFTTRVRVAKEQVAELNKELALFEMTKLFSSATAKKLEREAAKFEKVFTDTELPLAERESSLEAWRQLHIDVIDRTAGDIDAEIELLNQQMLQTGLLSEVSDLEVQLAEKEALLKTHQERLANSQSDFERKSALSSIGTAKEEISRLRRNLAEAETELAPMKIKILALQVNKEELGRARYDVLQEQLTFLEEVVTNVDDTVNEVESIWQKADKWLKKFGELLGALTPDESVDTTVKTPFDVPQWESDIDEIIGLNEYMTDTVGGAWYGMFSTMNHLQTESFADLFKNVELKTKAISTAIGATLGTVGALLGELQGLYDDDFKKQKKIELAGIVINTLSGMAMAIAQAMQLGPIAGPIVGALEAATIAAFGAIQYAKAKKVTPENSSADFSAPSVGSSSTLKGGAIPEAEYPGLKSSGPVDVDQTPTKAQVVGEDVYTQQSLDRHVTANAVF